MKSKNNFFAIDACESTVHCKVKVIVTKNQMTVGLKKLKIIPMTLVRVHNSFSILPVWCKFRCSKSDVKVEFEILKYNPRSCCTYSTSSLNENRKTRNSVIV